MALDSHQGFVVAKPEFNAFDREDVSEPGCGAPIFNTDLCCRRQHTGGRCQTQQIKQASRSLHCLLVACHDCTSMLLTGKFLGGHATNVFLTRFEISM